MESHAAFERNLARMRRRLGPVAKAVESAPEEDVEVVQGARGQLTVSSRGILLGSAYDPRREGERIAQEMAQEPADILVAIGFGLGYHLEAFRERNPCPIIVYEPSPARLRAALSTRTIPLLERTDVFVVTELSMLSALFSGRYTPGLRTQVYPHPSAWQLDPEAVREAVDRISRAKSTVDITAGTRVKMAAPWAALTVDNIPSLLRSASAEALNGKFRDMPAVICAAGPSLDKQIPLLHEYRDRVLIIAIGQALRSLRQGGIEPHLVHLVESQDVVHQITCAGDTSDLTMVLLPNCNPGLFELPVRARYVAYPATNQIGMWLSQAWGQRFWMNSGGTVAQTAVFLAHSFGADPILLIGQDLAFSDGRVYAKGSAYEDVGMQKSEDGYKLTNIGRKMRLFGKQVNHDGRTRTRKREIVWVDGWHGDKVPTSLAYSSFRENYRDIAAYLQRFGGTLLNCTEGGARIPRVEQLPFREALERHARKSVNVQSRLHAPFDAWDAPAPEIYEKRVARDRQVLSSIERDVEAACAEVESAQRRLSLARTPQRKIDVLRGVGRYEKKIRRRLGAIPWLDALVQAGLHLSAAASRRSTAVVPTPEQAVEEAKLLFETTAAGLETAHQLTERIEARLGEAYGEDSSAGEKDHEGTNRR